MKISCLIAATINTENDSLISIVSSTNKLQSKNQWYILEESLATKLILTRKYIPMSKSISDQFVNETGTQDYIQKFFNNHLVLACPDCQLYIWDWRSRDLVLKSRLIDSEGKYLLLRKLVYSSKINAQVFTANECKEFFVIPLQNLTSQNISTSVENMEQISITKKVHINDLAIHPKLVNILSMACSDGSIYNFNLDTMSVYSEMQDIINMRKLIGITNIIYSQNEGDLLISADTNGYINIWNGSEQLKSQNLLISKKVTDVYFLQMCWVKSSNEKQSFLLILDQRYFLYLIAINKIGEFYADVIIKIPDYSRLGIEKMIQNIVFGPELLLSNQNSYDYYIMKLKPKMIKRKKENNTAEDYWVYQYGLEKNNLESFINSFNEKNSVESENPFISKNLKIVPARPKALKTQYLFPDKNRIFYCYKYSYFLTQQKLIKYDHSSNKIHDLFSFKDHKILDGLPKQNAELQILPVAIDYRPKKQNYEKQKYLLFVNELMVYNNISSETKNYVIINDSSMNEDFSSTYVKLYEDTKFIGFLGHESEIDTKAPIQLIKNTMDQQLVTFKNSEAVSHTESNDEFHRRFKSIVEDDGNKESLIQNFSTKPINVFCTSLRKGFVVLYLFKNNFEYLRPSANFDNNEGQYKLNFQDENCENDIKLDKNGETVQNVVFKGGYFKLGAILTSKRILLVNERLLSIKKILLSEEIIGSVNNELRINYWFGNCVILQNSNKTFYANPMNSNLNELVSIKTDENSQSFAFSLAIDRLGIIWLTESQNEDLGFVQVRNQLVSTLPLVIDSLNYCIKFDGKNNIIKNELVDLLGRNFEDSILTNALSKEFFENGYKELIGLFMKGSSNNSMNLLDKTMLSIFFSSSKKDSDIDIKQILKTQLKISSEENDIIGFLRSSYKEFCYHNLLQELTKFCFALKEVKVAFQIQLIRESYLHILLLTRNYPEIEKNQLYWFKKTLAPISFQILQKKYQDLTIKHITVDDHNSKKDETDQNEILDDIQNKFMQDRSFIEMSNKFIKEKFNDILTPTEEFVGNQKSSIEIREIPKLTLEFDESAYNIVCENDSAYFKLKEDLLEEKLGFKTQLGTNLSNINANLGPSLVQGDANPDNEDDEQDENTNLVLYWHFSEGKETELVDVCNEKTGNGKIEGKSETFEWHEILDSKPMERIDKWGKDSGVQYYMSFKEGGNNYIKTQNKNWARSKFTNISIETWIRPLKDSGVIWASGGLEIMIGFKNRNQFIQNNNKKVEQKPINKDSEVKIEKLTWQHFAFSYDAKSSEVTFYLNTQKVLKGSTNLNVSKINATPILFFLQYYGDFTELRIWRNIKNESELKEEYLYPLSILAEKKSAITVIISKFVQDEPIQEDIKDGEEIEKKDFGFGSFAISGPEHDSKPTEFSSFGISMPQADTKPVKIIKEVESFNEKDDVKSVENPQQPVLPNPNVSFMNNNFNSEQQSKELESESQQQEAENIDENSIFTSIKFPNVDPSETYEIWEVSEKNYELQKLDESLLINTFQELVQNVLKIVRKFFIIDKFEEATETLSNFDAFVKKLKEERKSLSGVLMKSSLVLQFYKALCLRLTTIYFAEEDAIRKSNYMVIGNTMVESVDRIRVYYVTLKWLMNKKCFASAKKVLLNYTKLKKTENEINAAINHEQAEQIETWKNKLNDLPDNDEI